jgi:hypothetical protein
VGILAVLGTALCIAGWPLSPWPFYALVIVLAIRARSRLPALVPSIRFPRDRFARGLIFVALTLLLALAAAAR